MGLPGTSRGAAGLEQRTTGLPLCRINPFSSASSARLEPGRLRLAVRSGLVTLLIGWLAAALFLAPYWAAQTDFPGHQHPKGTPPHTHTIQAVIGYAMLAGVVVVTRVVQFAQAVVLWPTLWLERTTPQGAHGSRAPPLF